MDSYGYLWGHKSASYIQETKLCYIDLFVSTCTSKDVLKQTIASEDIVDSVILLTLTVKRLVNIT